MRKSIDHPYQITMDGSTRQQKLYDASIDLLRMTCPPEGFYLSTSFGKDSIAAHQLCEEAGVKYDAHTNHTGIDPPELIRFGQKYYPEPIVKREYAGISMWKLIVQKGIPPMRRKRYCCDVLKEDGGKGRTCVFGIRACESARRAEQWAPLTEFKPKGDRARDAKRLFEPDDIQFAVQSCSVRGNWTVSPLYHWNDADLWAFIKDRKLPYCELYDQGFHRLGCIGCPMAGQRLREHEFERWPTYRVAYVHAFDKLVKAGRFTKRNATCGEDIMQWWMQDKVQNEVDGQIEMW